MNKVQYFVTGAVLTMLAACGGNEFKVEGEVTNAKDSVLYFENVGLEGISVLDSVRLGEDGKFAFSEAAPEAPEFYRLRISDQIINVAIDSTPSRRDIPRWLLNTTSAVRTTT